MPVGGGIQERSAVAQRRHEAIAEVEELLGERRLVTLTGFVGIGKTSLAIEVARRMVDTCRDGV